MNEIFIVNGNYNPLWINSGIQVVISANNAEEFLPRCLESVESSCKKYNWSLIFADDDSNDKSLDIAKKYVDQSSCQNYIIKKFPKAKNVAQAKNRALNLTDILADKYSTICIVDSDDEMLPARIDYLLPKLIKENEKIIVGDYMLYDTSGNSQYINATEKNITKDLRFGAWATLFHQSLIPQNGLFFDENMEVYSDFLKWWKMRYEDKVNFIFYSGKPVYNFHRRKNSVSGEINQKHTLKIKEEKDRIHKLV